MKETVDLGEFVEVGPTYRFIGYRPDAAVLDKHSPGQLAPPNEPQYHGIVFADGSVAVRWLTAYRSTSTWDDLPTFLHVHGHPEYGTVIVWPDGKPAGVDGIFDQMRAEYAARPRVPTQAEQALSAALGEVEVQLACDLDEILSDETRAALAAIR